MRAALALTISLAVLASGCARPPVEYDEYPGENVAIDLRAGEYQPGQGFPEPLPISKPPHVVKQGAPDQPWVPRPLAVDPVQPSVSPVAGARLARLLPAPPAKWEAQEANAAALTTERGTMTEVSRSYWSGTVVRQGATPDGRDAHQSIDVAIVDRAQTGGSVVDPVAVAADERRGVRSKPVEVEGFTGQEFESGPGLKQLDLDVGDRFLVRVRGGHVSFEELRAWAAKVPLKDLSALR